MVENFTNNVVRTNHEFRNHIVLLHEKFGKRPEDSYILDIATALKGYYQKITILTSYFDENQTFDTARPFINGIFLSGAWIPNNICGLFKKIFSLYKSIWLAFQLVVDPPRPKPKIVILDVNAAALWFLRYFTNFKTIYVHHFSHLRCAESYCHNMVVVPDLLTIKTIGYADEIILQTKSLQSVFERSFPKVKNTSVWTPSYSTGLWKDNTIDVRRIVPDLPANYKLFVAFGDYKKKSNFLLILEALEEVIDFASQSFREEIHVVLAGNYKNECSKYYNKLIEKSKSKPFASQVTFLKQLPTIHKKTLIEACTALIHVVSYDLYPGSIVAAMSMAKPIIAVKNGFAETVLTHRISGIFVDPDPHKLASVMCKIANVATLQTFLGNMAKGLYINEFSYAVFCRKVQSLCNKYEALELPKCSTKM